MAVPSAWKLVSMIPVAAIPARKYWLKVTPPGTTWSPNTASKIDSISTG